MKQPEYKWFPEIGMAVCELEYDNTKFEGVAMCHPDDDDMSSRLTGQTIAEMRAYLKYLQHIKNNELRPQLKVLNQLYYAMNRSKHYNRKSYESKMLFRQIKNTTEDLAVIKEEIETVKKGLRDYINLKDSYYKEIRAHREKAKKD